MSGCADGSASFHRAAAGSDGRVELGIGAGWYEAEHTAYGIPFPGTGERFDRLEETLAVVTGLWDTPTGETFDFEGRHVAVHDSPALPKPVQTPRPPVIIGGRGKNRTPALAAHYADEFNAPFSSVPTCRELFARVRETCDEAGGDPDDLVLSNAQVLCVGSDEAELTRRAAFIGRDLADLRENDLAGTPPEVLDRLAEYAAAGSSRVYLQTLDLTDLEHLDLVAAEVLPHL